MRAPLLAAAILLALPLLAVMAFAPSAGAHSETVAQGRALEIGNYVAYLNPDPSVLYANTSNQAFTLQVTRSDVSGYATVEASMTIIGPGINQTLEFRPVNQQYMIASTTIPNHGNHTVRVTLMDDEGAHEETTTLEVYPDFPFRLRPLDAEQDVLPDRTTTLAYEVVDPITLERVDAFDDLTVRVEHWSPDHGTLLETEDIAATRVSVGLWRITHVFGEGHYYIRFASDGGGFNYTDLPLLHTNVFAPLGADEPSARGGLQTPAPGALGAALALAAAAGLVASAARARRRR